VRETAYASFERGLERLGHLLGGNAVVGGLFAIDDETNFLLRVFDVPIRIDYSWRAFKTLRELEPTTPQNVTF
jgi:hypothetical protein